MGMKRLEIDKRFDEIVDFAGLTEFIDTPVKRYSSGMNARLGFSIAAHLRPQVLIIDEVLSVGDMVFQKRCVERMLAIKADGAAIVFVSHDLSAIALMCDATLCLAQGFPGFVGQTTSAIAHYLQSSQAPLSDSSSRTRALEVPRVVGIDVIGGRGLMSLRPGDRVVVTVQVPPASAPRVRLLVIYIVQQGSQLVAHNSNIPLTIPPSREALQVSVEMTLNLLRGLYSVNLSISDPATQDHAWAEPAPLVGVEETDSYEGIASIPARVSIRDTASYTERSDVFSTIA
jgi:lipopolysaccharide transport system ATP-binding protein